MVKASSDKKPVPKKVSNQSDKSPSQKTQHKGNLSHAKAGRVEKATNQRPLPKKVLMANKNARKALATGELASAEIELKKQKDLRTLYIKFKDGHQPSTEKEIRSICPSVQYVRIPRKDKNKINYCFVEYDSEAECDNMKEELSNSPDRFFVDYVGEKSRNLKFTAKDVSAKKRPINPLRLFVSGLPANMTVAKLSMLFPKCSNAHIKTKGSPVGFVQFRNAGDAKSAFEAAQKLSGIDAPPGIPKLTVIYARMSKRQSLVKQEERKLKKKNNGNETSTTVKTDDDDENGEAVEDAEVASDDKAEDDEEVKEESDDEEVEGSGDAEEVKEESDEDDDDEEVQNDEDSEEEGMDDE